MNWIKQLLCNHKYVLRFSNNTWELICKKCDNVTAEIKEIENPSVFYEAWKKQQILSNH